VARLSTTVRLHASVIGMSAFNFRGVSSRVVSRTFKSWVENIARVYGVLWHLPKIISATNEISKPPSVWPVTHPQNLSSADLAKRDENLALAHVRLAAVRHQEIIANQYIASVPVELHRLCADCSADHVQIALVQWCAIAIGRV
ncbi:MAG: hypothetical protein JWM68_776, partial [Verrucomicrobiales bacterium]|nr:hypothetical protein [Verrucomicrobiales bacterium]